MSASSLWVRGRQTVASFFEQVKKSNEPIYLCLLTAYVMRFYLLRIYWTLTYRDAMETANMALTWAVLGAAALYLFFTCVRWQPLRERKILLVAIAVAMAGGIAWFYFKGMPSNAYTVVLDVFFCLMACGKSYKKCLRCVMFVAAGTLLVAAIGLFVPFSWDVMKPDNVSPGHSFGINYPNTWGYTAFSAMIICWYLYLRQKPVLTFALFWGVSLFMFFVISCRTIALLAMLFPVAAAFTGWWESRPAPLRTDGRGKTILSWLAVSIPFIFLAFNLALCLNYEWVRRTFYSTRLHTLAMRFVQGGLYLKMYGSNLLGNVYSSSDNYSVVVNGVTEALGILDNSFVSYIVVRGILWVLGCLGWQSLAIWKAVRRRDYAIPFLCAVILAYATMERPGLNVWYNFVLLYPLAVAGAGGAKEGERP